MLERARYIHASKLGDEMSEIAAIAVRAEQGAEGVPQERGHVAPRSPRGRRRSARTLLVVTVVLLLASSCRVTVHQRIDTARAAAGQDPVTTSPSLEAAAGARASAMCAARSASTSPDPLAEFDAETASAADDLAGSAPLDPSITDGAARNIAATEAVVAGWGDDPLLTDARWDDVGVGEATCPDGRLYVSAAFTRRPTMPATGRYSSPVYSSSQVTVRRALQYGTAPTYLGVVQPLLLDVWTPPAGSGPRPLVVLVHGGGFQGGTRDQWDGGAMDFATRGYVVASISYRLRPASQPLLPKAADAIDDGMESVRWLRANAATYGIDTSRIAMMGTSAGGVVALGVALADDPTPGGPLAAVSPRIDAAVSTGAHLTPGLSTLTLGPDEPPTLLVHFEVDDTTTNTSAYAFETCAAVRAAGSTCDFEEVPGTGHQSWISPGGPIWAARSGPFLFEHLRLAGPG